MDIAERLAKERRARLAAERLLEQKSRELFAANEKLGLHARSLSDQIVVQREVRTKYRTCQFIQIRCRLFVARTVN